MNKNFIFLFLGIFVLFIGLHVAGLHIPYHQDEYKWPLYAEEKVFEPGSVVHPPLTEFLYRVIGKNIDLNNFRFIPFIFGTTNFFLLFYLAKTIFDRRTALLTIFLFTVSFYSLLASLMVDVDGAVMPMFFLIMVIGYYKLRLANFQLAGNKKWLGLFILGAIGGFLVKMSGVLPLAAVAIDFAIIKGFFEDKKRFVRFLGLGLGLACLVVMILLLAKIVFPFFPIEKSLAYWKHFADSSSFLDRGWLQTFIQFSKSILYTSPLLILPVFFVNKEIWFRLRPFFFFIFIGLAFYLLVFDFSIGALDRYFQFLILPLCIISGAIFSNFQFKISNFQKIIVLTISAVIFSLQFINHFVPPLYPKTEWISRVVTLKWASLFPFTGGSGPTGFYVSFLFILLIWLISLAFIKKRFLLGILILGVLYNGVFIEEYLFGKINGSPYELFQNAKSFIIKNTEIKQVIVYNDIGGYEIRQTGKYFRRMYVAPQFEEGYKNILSKFDGHILYINIPRVYENSFYAKYFQSCTTIFQEKDKQIESQVLDCEE